MSRPGRSYTIGIEIEGIVSANAPWRDSIQCHQRLVEELRNLGESAVVNKRPNLRAADYYNTGWQLTSDDSLQPGRGEFGFEAISPIYLFEAPRWDLGIRNFARAVEHSPFSLVSHNSASTHVHVQTAGRDFTLDELKTICFASILYEWHMFQLMPVHRKSSRFCRGVMRGRGSITRLFQGGFNAQDKGHVQILGQEIQRTRDKSELVAFVQGDSRLMLWNFLNTIKASGTIEFRGGGQSTAPTAVRNYVYIAVGFIELALQEDLLWSNTCVAVDWDHQALLGRMIRATTPVAPSSRW